MNKLFIILSTLILAVSISSCAPAQPAASNAQQAIEQSKAKGDVQSQVNYLSGQAKAFVNSKNFDQAVAVANYILNNLDKNSQAAKDILAQAKAEMQKTAQGAMQDVKNKFGGFGK